MLFVGTYNRIGITIGMMKLSGCNLCADDVVHPIDRYMQFLTVIYFSKYMLHRALLKEWQSIPKICTLFNF